MVAQHPAALVQRRVEIADVADRVQQLRVNLRVVPGLAQRLHGALHRVLHGPAHGVCRDGMAQLIHAGMPPLLLDDLLQAAVALGIQAALRRQRLLHGRHARIDARRLGQIVADPRLLRRHLFRRGRLGSRLFRRRLLRSGLFLRLRRGLFLTLRRRLFRPRSLAPGCGNLDHRGQRARQAYGKVQLLAREAGNVEALQFFFLQRLTVRRDPGALLPILRRGVGPGLRRGTAQHPGRGRSVAAPGSPFALELHDLEDHVLRRLTHHIGIDDVGVALGFVAFIVFVGTDFVVFSGVLPQIQHAIAAHAAHAGLEVAGLVLVRHDADAALLGIDLLRRYGLVPALVLHQQGLHSEIGFEGIVFFQNTNTQFARQHRFPPSFNCTITRRAPQRRP